MEQLRLAVQKLIVDNEQKVCFVALVLLFLDYCSFCFLR